MLLRNISSLLLILFYVGCSEKNDLKNASLPNDFADHMVNSGVSTWNFSPKNPLLDSGKIVITSRINEVVSKEIISKLLYLDGKVNSIDLYLRTTGGWINDAFAIIDIMKSIKTPVNVHAIGICQSAGSIILIGATGKRVAYKNSDIALHFNRDDDDDSYSMEKINRERFERLFKERTKLPSEWYPLTGDRSLHLTANEALRLGVIDTIK